MTDILVTLLSGSPRDLLKNVFNDEANLNFFLQSLCSIHFKVDNNEDLSISVLINESVYRNVNDGTREITGGVNDGTREIPGVPRYEPK